MKGLIILEDRVEDIEGIASRALLRRAGINVDTATTNLNKVIKTGYGVSVMVDYNLSDLDLEKYDFLIIPGGPYVAGMYEQETQIHQAARHFYERKKLIGAICAAPRIIGHLGYLENLEFTCYPGAQGGIKGGIYKPNQKVIVHERIITAKSPAYVTNFIYEIVAKVFDKDRADALLKHLAHLD